MLRAMIVDDEQPAIKMMQILLAANPYVQVVGAFDDFAKALDELEDINPDVVFLDIEMPGMNGLTVAEQMRQFNSNLYIVFVTAYRHYAVEAFEINALDYLLKPALQEHVDRAISRLIKVRGTQPWYERAGKTSGIYCLGVPEVLGAVDLRPIKWRTAKTEEMFLFLLHNRNEAVPKDRIVEYLWPHLDPKDVNTYLHTTVYRLKKTLKEAGLDISIQYRRGAYQIDLGDSVYFDAMVFENKTGWCRPVDQGSIKEYEALMELYRGDYCEARDYAWSMAKRSQLLELYCQLGKKLTSFYVEAREFDRAGQLIDKVLLRSPFDEEAHEYKIQMFHARNDRIGLMNYYQYVEGLMRKELRVDPRPSLKTMYRNFMNSYA